MADKSFGVKEIELIGASGTPTIESPNNLEIKAVNVAISTDITVGGMVSLGAGTSISSPGTNVLTFGTNSTEKVRITSSGNVGIGSAIPGGVLDLYHATSNTILNLKSGDAGTVLNLIDNSARSSIEQNGTSLKISSDTGAEFANSDIRLQTDGSTRVLINSVGDVLLGGLTSKNDGRNAKGITLKSSAGISFQNFGSNGSRNWRIRPDDLSNWGSLEFSVSPTDNNNTDWPDAAGDVVLELKKDKDVVVKNGNLVIGTSGNGIDFSATTDGPNVSSELLDDYEEGTWTPTINITTTPITGITYTRQAGYYTRIGNVCHVSMWITWSARTNNSSSTASITLPFTSKNANEYRGAMHVSTENCTYADYGFDSSSTRNIGAMAGTHLNQNVAYMEISFTGKNGGAWGSAGLRVNGLGSSGGNMQLAGTYLVQ